MRETPPLSVILAAVWLALGGFSGLLDVFLDIELFSIAGLFLMVLYALILYTIYALFFVRNVGRILAAIQLVLSGLFSAAVAVFLSMGGASVAFVVMYILIAALELTLAWHLVVGAPARKYANVAPI